MDKLEFKKFVEGIMTRVAEHDTDGSISTELTSVMDEFNSVYDKNESLTHENDTYKSNNEKLREANMKLFLRVGEEKKPEAKDEAEEPKEEKLKFEDLFDDKGLLK